MSTRDNLTTESIKDCDLGSFELANLAIEIMRHYIRSGHEISVSEVLELIRLKGIHAVYEELSFDNEDESASKE